MPKTKERLTKARVLEEVTDLRKRINTLHDMSEPEFVEEFYNTFPGQREARGTEFEVPPRSMLRSLLISATYRMTNVLGIE